MAMPLTIFNNYAMLPESQLIKSFVDYVKKCAKLQSDEELRYCFLIAHNLKEAYLIISLCFGGLKTSEMLEKLNLPPAVNKRISQKLSIFCWDRNLPIIEMFQRNAKLLGQYYPYFHSQVFKHVNQIESKKLFDQIKEQPYLYGVKIREWPYIKKRNISLNRKNEKNELDRVDGMNYLLMAKGDRGKYTVGFLYEDKQFQSSRYSQSIREENINYKKEPINHQQIKLQQQSMKKRTTSDYSNESNKNNNNQIRKVDSRPNNLQNKSVKNGPLFYQNPKTRKQNVYHRLKQDNNQQTKQAKQAKCRLCPCQLI